MRSVTMTEFKQRASRILDEGNPPPKFDTARWTGIAYQCGS